VTLRTPKVIKLEIFVQPGLKRDTGLKIAGFGRRFQSNRQSAEIAGKISCSTKNE